MKPVTRRSVMAGSAAVVAAVPAVALGSVGTKAVDPIFAAIAAHKAARKKVFRLWDALDSAESAARATHGQRPYALITWRNYTIGGYEIDERYEAFLNGRTWEGADPGEIEREYLDAKCRYREAVQSGKDWDKRAGVASLHKDRDRARAAERRESRALAQTKPATAAGAAALLAYLLRDMTEDFCPEDWHRRALNTVKSALANGSGSLSFRTRRCRGPA